MNNIILIGFKNSGKTSVGKSLAQRLQKSFIDTDTLIEKHYATKTGQTLSTKAIYKKEGADYFRALEKNCVALLVDFSDAVIATGGGCVIDPDNRKQLKNSGIVIYLKTPIDIIKTRSKKKPAFIKETNSDDAWITLYQERLPMYEACATVTIETAKKKVAALVDDIINILGEHNG